MRPLRSLLQSVLLLAVLGSVLVAGCGAEEKRAPAALDAGPGPGWTVYHDDQRGYTATFPSGWHRARENLTPGLADPREILSLGTYPLRYDPAARCRAPMCPVPALDDLGPADVLLSVQESSAAAAGFAERRRPARLSRVDLRYPEGVRPCTRGRVGWMAFDGFRDSGRDFYVFAAVGTRVSPRTRRELQRVLDSLRFDLQGGAGPR